MTCCAAPGGSGGSVTNLRSLRVGFIDVAIVQADLQAHAYQGSGVFWREGADKKLRALFSVVAETFSVVVRDDGGISEIADLKGRRVNLGAPGSGQRAVMTSLMAQLDLSDDDFAATTETPSALQVPRLCDRQIDAALFVVAHPNPAMQEAVRGCDAVILPVSGPKIDGYVAGNPHLVKASIAGGVYRSIPEPVPSFGVAATLVASSETPAETVYHLVKAVFENLEEMRRLLPVFAGLDRSFMLAPHHSAPLHPGAVKYFKEAGLM